MWSGRKALSELDQSLKSVRDGIVRLDGHVSSLTAQVSQQEQRRLALLKQMARIRLTELESGKLQVSLDRTDSNIKDLLRQREAAFTVLNNEIDSKNQAIAQLESQRAGELESYNEASQQLLEIEAKVQAELKLKTDYLDQLSRANQAESVAEEAERKVAIANQDLTEKARPYQADALFMYLWERDFGTADYSAGLFSRFMDSWVAKLIKYEPARQNFWNLNEIPRRLEEHAHRVANIADGELDKLQTIETSALSNAGADQVEATLRQYREALDNLDDQIELAESQLNDLLSTRSSFDSGEDQYFRQCLSEITAALAQQDVEALNQSVQQTRSAEDDRLIFELRSLEGTVSTLKQELQSAGKLHGAQISKLRDLEGVRHQFKNSRYDDVRSGFINQELIESALTQFLKGLVSGADLWGTLQRNQRYREQDVAPDFGSGGFGDLVEVIDILNRSDVDIGDILKPRAPKRSRRRRKNKSTWHVPKPRRSGGGFNLPRSRSGSRGGFKTGGGF